MPKFNPPLPLPPVCPPGPKSSSPLPPPDEKNRPCVGPLPVGEAGVLSDLRPKGIENLPDVFRIPIIVLMSGKDEACVGLLMLCLPLICMYGSSSSSSNDKRSGGAASFYAKKPLPTCISDIGDIREICGEIGPRDRYHVIRRARG